MRLDEDFDHLCPSRWPMDEVATCTVNPSEKFLVPPGSFMEAAYEARRECRLPTYPSGRPLAVMG